MRRCSPGASIWLMLVTVMMVGIGCANDGRNTSVSPTPNPSGPAQAIIAVGQRPGVPVSGEGAVWVPNTGDGTVSRIDPRTNRVVGTLRIGNQLAFYKRDCEAKGSVHSYMGTSFHVRDCDLPSALSVGAGTLWILKNDEQMVLRVDPRSQRVLAGIAVGFVPFDIAATDNAVWITGYWADQLARIDPKTNEVVARLTVPDGASGVAVSDEAVWVASTIAGELSRIDPMTNRVVASIVLACPNACYQGSLPLAVAASKNAVLSPAVGDGVGGPNEATTNHALCTRRGMAFLGW